MNIRKYIVIIAASVGFGTAMAQQYVNWHNEAADTITVNCLLKKGVMVSDPEQRIYTLALQFADTPYEAGTLENNGEERLTINLDAVDCTTLVEYVAALALTAGENRTSWRDFVYNLERMRYRGGELNGYASRLHYISDWIVDNTHRGNIEEATGQCGFATYEVKTIDFMSANRGLYPALSDSATYAKLKEAEIGYRSHRFPIIKTSRVEKAAKAFLHTGDIIAICSGKKGLDVAHMGILYLDEKKVPYMLHASSKAGKVILDATPLHQYLARNRHTGIRVIRLKN